MKVEVLGTGCGTCKELFKNVEEVIAELNIEAEIVKVEDIQKIMAYGIMSVPALVINGKMIFFGKSPRKDELKKYFLQAIDKN